MFIKKWNKNGKPREVLVTNKLRIDHPEIGNWGAYHSGGLLTEVKPKKPVVFKPLAQSITFPKTESDMFFLNHPNEEKMYQNYGDQLHYATLGMWEFQRVNGHMPGLHNKEDAAEVINLAKQILEKNKTVEGAHVVENINEDNIRNTSLYAAVELCGFLLHS